MNDKITTLLILKYGSMENAFIEWMTEEYETFSLEEHEALIVYEQEKYPNLKLKHPQKVDKPV